VAGQYSSFRSAVRCPSGGIDSPCGCVVDRQRDQGCDPGRGGLSRLAAIAAVASRNALDREGAPAIHPLTPWRPWFTPRSSCPGRPGHSAERAREVLEAAWPERSLLDGINHRARAAVCFAFWSGIGLRAAGCPGWVGGVGGQALALELDSPVVSVEQEKTLRLVELLTDSWTGQMPRNWGAAAGLLEELTRLGRCGDGQPSRRRCDL
jgi:hypothetical protein